MIRKFDLKQGETNENNIYTQTFFDWDGGYRVAAGSRLFAERGD